MRSPAVLLAVLVLLAAAPAAHGQARAETGSGGVTSTDPSTDSPAAAPAEQPTGPSSAPGAAYGLTTSSHTNLRGQASSGGTRVARVGKGTRLRVSCQRLGAIAPGRQGRSRVWDRVALPSGKRAWVADGYLDTGSDLLVAKVCGAPGYVAPAAGATSGSCPVGTPVTLLPPFGTTEELIDAALPGARASQHQDRVPVAVTLAQTILETGGGRIAAGANNYFGIKARATGQRGVYDWGQNASGCVLKKSVEAEPDGRLVISIGAFRAYDTIDASILDHGALLTGNPVYRSAFSYTGDAQRFARVIARHYATDPNYAGKLIALMKRYKLESR